MQKGWTTLIFIVAIYIIFRVVFSLIYDIDEQFESEDAMAELTQAKVDLLKAFGS
jgi:hypothetical protein